MRVPAHPGLYDVSGSPPVLKGTRCGSCGVSFFPPLTIGCEACGSPDVEEMDLAARGRLHSFATVHRHRSGDIEAPFTIAEIVLDDGPVIRATMTTNDGFAIGDLVEAEWVVNAVDDAGRETVEPRFGRRQ
jgi:uncharacterized OB-fold protein